MDDQILIIESNTFALKKLREILSREGYNIMTVTSKEAALNICSKIKIDYIIANPQEFDISKTIEEEQK